MLYYMWDIFQINFTINWEYGKKYNNAHFHTLGNSKIISVTILEKKEREYKESNLLNYFKNIRLF